MELHCTLTILYCLNFEHEVGEEKHSYSIDENELYWQITEFWSIYLNYAATSLKISMVMYKYEQDVHWSIVYSKKVKQ